MLNSEKTLKSANEFASSYDSYIPGCNWVGPDILLGLMFEFLQPGQCLLDIGIGTGLSSAGFHKFGLRIFGIDGAENMLLACRKKNIAEELQLADLSKDIPWFENRHFNHAIAHALFHLLGDLELPLTKVHSALEMGGVFGFTCEGTGRSMEDYSESTIKGIYEKKIIATGISAFRHTDKYIHDLLSGKGFKIKKQTEFLAFVDSTTKAKTWFNAIIAIKV
ncbi:MAG: methyltransferase domain-containing protein [Bacteroidetes bacterium]|nr:methyltransferase domain-containing protein [Bacteroidota bacterium]